MAQLAGKYVYEKEENVFNYFKALGLNEEQTKGVLAATKELEIKGGDKEYTLTSGLGTRVFPLDKEIEEKLPDGRVLKSTASLSGNKLTIKSLGDDGKKGNRVYETSGSGVVLTFNTEGVGGAKVFFKRV